MAVPGHDQRDWEFAREFGLPIVEVIAGGDISEAAYTGDGALVNSRLPRRAGRGGRPRRRSPSGWRPTAAAGRASNSSCGTGFSRGSGTGVSRSRSSTTPTDAPHAAAGVGAAGGAARCRRTTRRCCSTPTTPTASRHRRWPRRPSGCTSSWIWATACKPYTRDTNVMPQWAGSSWYELRYTDPHNSERFCAKENEAYWMGPRPAEHGADDPGGVDLYVGGVEHAVLHLLYSRFWHKVLYDLGHVSSREPYRRLGEPGLHPGVRLHRFARRLCAGRRGRRARRQVLPARAPTARSRSSRSSARSARA